MIHRSKCGAVVAVSDGVGSVEHAKEGADAAVAAASLVGDAWLRGALTADRVPATITKRWRMSIAVEPASAACTVVVAAVSAEGRWLAASLGDSPAVVWSRARLHLPPGRETFADWTRALGGSATDADGWITMVGEGFGPGDAILLATDGVADDLELGRLPEIAERFRAEVARSGELATSAALEEQLRAWPSAGHRDDKTLALVLA